MGSPLSSTELSSPTVIVRGEGVRVLFAESSLRLSSAESSRVFEAEIVTPPSAWVARVRGASALPTSWTRFPPTRSMQSPVTLTWRRPSTSVTSRPDTETWRAPSICALLSPVTDTWCCPWTEREWPPRACARARSPRAPQPITCCAR